MLQEIGLGLLRNALLSAGAAFVTSGALTQNELGMVVGAIITIASVVASAISNRSKAKANAVVAAVEAHPDLKIIPASQSLTSRPEVIVRTPVGAPGGLSQTGH